MLLVGGWRHVLLVDGWRHVLLVGGWRHVLLVGGWRHVLLVDGWRHVLLVGGWRHVLLVDGLRHVLLVDGGDTCCWWRHLPFKEVSGDSYKWCGRICPYMPLSLEIFVDQKCRLGLFLWRRILYLGSP